MKKIFLFLTCIAVFGISTNTQAISLLTPVKKQTTSSVEKNVSTLPVQMTENGRNYLDARIQLPQQGDNRGVFTRPVVIYDARNSFSVVYKWKSTVTTIDEQPYMGVIEPPKRKTQASLPKPHVKDATFLGGFFIQTEEDVRFSPVATVRFPLAEQQQGNDGITVYFYDKNIGGYIQIEYTPSSSGSGIMIPIEKNGYYAIYDRPGTVPNGKHSGSLLRQKISAVAKNDDQTFAISNTFADIQGHWAETYIKKLDALGIAPGKNPLLFAPDEAATRADVIKMVIDKKFSKEETNACMNKYLPSKYVNVFFKDISQNHPYAKYICMSAVHKISVGLNDGTFAADRPVSRAEALKLLYSAIDIEIPETKEITFGDVSAKDWFTPYVEFAAKNNVTKGFPMTKTMIKAVESGLKKGDTGKKIKNAKQALSDLNFYAGKVDTIFDSGFKTAVIQYQLAKGIIDTPIDLGAGIIGVKTAALINIESGRENKSQTAMIFKPNAHVTRAELSKFASLIFGL